MSLERLLIKSSTEIKRIPDDWNDAITHRTSGNFLNFEGGFDENNAYSSVSIIGNNRM